MAPVWLCIPAGQEDKRCSDKPSACTTLFLPGLVAVNGLAEKRPLMQSCWHSPTSLFYKGGIPPQWMVATSPWFHHGFTMFFSPGKAARLSFHAAPRTGSLHQRHGRLGLVGSWDRTDGGSRGFVWLKSSDVQWFIYISRYYWTLLKWW